MQLEKTILPGVLIIIPPRFGDARGWFCETWNAEKLALLGITTNFLQDNHSYSAAKGTLRGLHYQRPPHAQDKLVRCSRGTVFDVAVDIRRGSPTYGKWVGVELSAENGKQLFIPKGLLHGFVTLEKNCELQYKCSDFYAPDYDGGIRWDDQTIGVDWGLKEDAPVLSAKDAVAPLMADFKTPFDWRGSL